MVIVVGAVVVRGSGLEAAPEGLAGRIAVAAAQAGVPVEVVARIGVDPAGDELLLALARAGIGHVAVLRDSVHATPRVPDIDDAVVPGESGDGTVPSGAGGLILDGPDVDLALRYLTDYRVVVVVHPTADVLAAAVGASSWAGAHLVVVASPDARPPTDLSSGALVIAAAESVDGSDAVGERLGVYAAAIDRGDEPAAAYAALVNVPGSV